MKLLPLLIAVLPLVMAPACPEEDIHKMPQVQFTEDCLTHTVEANMGSGWFEPGWTQTLEPPLGLGDCVALPTGAEVQVRSCCDYGEGKVCSGAAVPNEYRWPCKRLFDFTGKEYPLATGGGG